ncbi:hypothetical protein LCGC14_0462000 [marine sediment metagenome]|uniref:Uncharacterized protein n=1 Tax=marine sediment metagenome TaxID=412755 RepID=A0A0F9V1F1_9ZZZZ
MKIDKRRIKNANESIILSIQTLVILVVLIGFLLGFMYLIFKVSYWFILLIIPLIWFTGYFANPERHTI